MSSALINIGATGAKAARISLEVTAQNIANAETEGYVRRRANVEEMAATGSASGSGTAFNGVRYVGITRPENEFLQAEARRSGSSLARADAELAGLKAAESAVEQSGLYNGLVELEAAMARLESDPLDPALRANALEQGRVLAGSFGIASEAVEAASRSTLFQAETGVSEVNRLSAQLAKLNESLLRSDTASSGHSSLLDQRDVILRDLSEHIGISAEFTPTGAANVRVNDGSGAALVSGDTAATLTLGQNSDGSLAFAVGGNVVSPGAGSLAGHSSALAAQADLRVELDNLASSVITSFNASQANGTAQDGSAGQPFFAGRGAGDIALALTSGDKIATAPAGAPAQSVDVGNLQSLRAVLANNGPASQADALLFDVSSNVRSRSITRDALSTLAGNAQGALATATEVDLEAEAANLVRYQQAFQASGRVMQVAGEIFETILGIR